MKRVLIASRPLVRDRATALASCRRPLYSPLSVNAGAGSLIQVPGTVQIRNFARKSRSQSAEPKKAAVTENVPAVKEEYAVHDPWQAVTDRDSGLVYWWNTDTDETTALGAPKPTAAGAYQGAPPPQGAQQGYAEPTLGQTMAQGAAFGVGAGVGRAAIGSLFGAFGGDDGRFTLLCVLENNC
mmetsp:Transcript_11058/g.20521  ORF Transcript_11058/g.20521 Transcript_11058/m.20521 type:complete len:183 (+) Transcript_11058:326-874(+)